MKTQLKVPGQLRALVRNAPLTALLLALSMTSVPAWAQGYFGPQQIQVLRIQTAQTMLRLAGSPPSTCSSFGEQFLLDTSTLFGKQALAVIMAAQATNRPLIVWYTHSTAPGTNETNGCTYPASAKLTGVRLGD